MRRPKRRIAEPAPRAGRPIVARVAARVRCEEGLMLLTGAFPYLNVVLERFAWHFTESIRTPTGDALVDVALRSAMTATQRAQSSSDHRHALKVAQAFVHGLLEPVLCVRDVEVVGHGGTWDPLGRVALGDFLQTDAPTRVQGVELPNALTHLDAWTFRTALALRILTAHELAALGGALAPLIPVGES